MDRRVRVAVSVLLLGSASACGNVLDVDINGMTGISVDSSGRPVLVAEVCHGVVAGVTVTGPNRGEIANEIRAELTVAKPLDQSFVVDLARPAGDWTGQALELPLGSDLYIAVAHGGDVADSQLTQVTFTSTDLADLSPETVQFNSGDLGEQSQRVDAAAFARIACAN